MGSDIQVDAPSVLLVDDTPANLVALRAVLEPLAVRLVEAQSGAEALERVARETFAVVLLDVQMPEMDGFEVARRLRTTAAGFEVPIIFLTAIHRDDAYSRMGYASGGADYITKPFDPAVLRARVKAFVDLFSQRERLRVRQVGERTRQRDEALESLAELLERERTARREAELASRAKDDFLATVSHELRTPLSAILGWAAIARGLSPPARLEQALTIIERNAHAQLRIIEDLLDLRGAMSGSIQMQISSSCIPEILEGAVLAVRPAAESKDIALGADVQADAGTIAGDPDRLRQVVCNVLTNAVKFTPAGGRIDVSARRLEPNIVIRVSDTGEGISAEFLPHVFEPFRQGDSSTSRRHGGVGLGLAIARRIVEAHGGRIAVESGGVGRGATFTIELPALAPPEDAHASDGGGLPGEDARLDGVRVLLVDDDEDSRALIEVLLSRRGAAVTSASSADEALRLLEARRPDVFLSDIGMPTVDGYTLIRRVRSMPASRGGRTPSAALTAYARPSDGERALAAGFQAHVMKPVDEGRLISVVAKLAASGAG
jgi:signal transduction histidine kinase